MANMFQISYQTILTLLWSYCETILHTFPDIKQYWLFQRVVGKQYERGYIKQYWHFQGILSKLNYSKNFFQGTCHTIMILSGSYYQTILTYLELISNSIHTSTELLPNIVNTFYETLNGHLNRQKFLKRRILN